MPVTRSSSTTNLALDRVIARLANNQTVDGLIVVGSSAAATMNPASDYDLVLILSTTPVPLHTGVTNIDGRFTDLLFHTAAEIDQILAATKPFDFWDWTGRLVGWLATGDIRFDGHGKLAVAQNKVRNGTWIIPAADQAMYSAWQTINYNLAVIRRYLTADDPTYLAAADLRMAIYGPQDLFWHYFTVRGLPPDSEKAQLLYLQVHDPNFLTTFQRFLIEPDRHVKFAHYTALAARAGTDRQTLADG